MSSVVITPISAIQPSENGKTIEVRVCRLWRAKILKVTERDDGLQCVLVDKNMSAIHAIVKEGYFDDVKDKIKEGCVYQISKFHSKECQEKYIVVDHRAQLLFNNKTIFTPLPDPLDFPQHWFDFVDFDKLYLRENDDRFLTDVIGRLKVVYPLEETLIEGRKTLKRLLHIQDSRNHDLKLTLWGTLAADFDVSAIKKLPPPVVMVVTSTKVRRFDTTIVNSGLSTCVFINPSIPEIEKYQANFNKPYHSPKFMGRDFQDEDIINVSTLNLQSGKKDKTETFVCKAKITKILVRDGWYYLGCPTCSKALRTDFNSGKLCCFTHGEQLGHPIYKMELMLEDEDDSTTATIIGKAAENLFKIACTELVNERGEDDKYNIPSDMQKANGKSYIWRIGHVLRDDFLIKDVYHEKVDDEVIVYSDMVSHPSTPAKRTASDQKEPTLNQIYNKRLKRGEGSTGTTKDGMKVASTPKIGAKKITPKGQSSMSKIKED